MLREWTDKLPSEQAEEIWREQSLREILRRLSAIESDLQDEVTTSLVAPAGFYDAMRHFIALRATMFPSLPIDPAWNILVTLASTPEGSPKACVTSIAYGAGVPLATALRYIAMLEVEGVVRRLPDPTDKRRSIIELTPEGRQRLDAIADQWKMRAMVALIAIPVGVTCLLSFAGLA